MADQIHSVLDLVMLLEVTAGSIFLAAVLFDWVLDRLLRCLKLHKLFRDFIFERAWKEAAAKAAERAE